MAEEAVTLESAPQKEEPVKVEEELKDCWIEKGWSPVNAKLCADLEDLREVHHLPFEVQQTIEKLTNATSVADFNEISDMQIAQMYNHIRVDLPTYSREIREFLSHINRARTITVDVDYI